MTGNRVKEILENSCKSKLEDIWAIFCHFLEYAIMLNMKALDVFPP